MSVVRNQPLLPSSSAIQTRTNFDAVTKPAIILSICMATIIIGTVFFGKTVAFFSILPLIIAVLAYSLRNPMVAFIVLYSYASMEGMYKYLSEFSPVVYAIAPLMLGAVFVGWNLSLRNKGVKPAVPPLAAVMLLYTVWGCFEVFNPSGAGFLGSAASLFVWYLGPLAMYVVGYNGVKSSKQVMQFIYAIGAICTIVSAFAIVQFSMGQEWTFSHLPGYEKITATDWFVLNAQGEVTAASFRPASTSSSGGGGAGWSHLGMVLSVGLLFMPGLTMRRRVAIIACLMINIIGLFVTGVRSWLFVGIFEIAVLFLISARSSREMMRNIGLLLSIAAVAGLGFIGAQSLSGGMIEQRYADTARNPLAKFQLDRGNNITALFKYVANYPLGSGYQQGLGRGAIGYSDGNDPAINTRNGETEFGAIAGDMGLPGLALLYGLMIGTYVYGWRASRRLQNARLRISAAILIASLSGYFAMSFAGPVMQGASYYWFTAAILAVLPGIEKRERTAEAETKNS